jgi:uncharacterized protein YktA (UPF0223 family)
MGDVIEFPKPIAKTTKEQHYDTFLRILRSYMEENEVCRVIAALHDQSCYQMADRYIKNLADAYKACLN